MLLPELQQQHLLSGHSGNEYGTNRWGSRVRDLFRTRYWG